MADKDPRHVDRAAEEARQEGIAEKVAQNDADYAKATITGEGSDGRPTRSVVSSPPPEKDKK